MQNFSKERSRFCKQYSDVADSKRFNGLSGWEWEIFKKLVVVAYQYSQTL